MSPESGDTLGWRFAESDCSAELQPGETLYTAGLSTQDDILDALYDATGTMAHCVWLWDKNQTLLWRREARDLLPEFARRVAIDVVHLWPEAPPCVHRFLSTGKDANAARAAANAVIRAAAYNATAYAANAARAAANAARAARAARAAANAVIRAAAYNATHAAATKKYADVLISMLVEKVKTT